MSSEANHVCFYSHIIVLNRADQINPCVKQYDPSRGMQIENATDVYITQLAKSS